MTEFVYEQINELNATLSSLFRDQSISVDTQSTNPTDLGATLEKDRDLTAFLTLASRDIDLSSNTTLPDIDAIQKYLSTYAQSPKQVTAVEDSLEWLFIAKCTVAVYGFLLKNILSSTLPLSEAIAYWNSIYGSTRYESYYALQTLPIRVGYLGINTVKKMRTTQLGLKSILLDSPEHLFWNMFPTHAKNWIKKSQQKSFRLFGLKHDSIFKQLIHEEIRQKIQTLDHFRTQQASRLGLLMKVTPFTAVINREDLLKTVSIESKLCLASMKNILTPLLSVDNIITSHFKVQDTIDLIRVSAQSSENDSPRDIAQGLSKIIESWTHCQVNITNVKAVYGPPSFLTRYWIPGVLGYFAANAAIQLISAHQTDIINWFKELGETAKDFAVNWIWEPILQVWDTIRLKDERLDVLGKEGLRSDLESLERMVAEFARDHYHFPEEKVNSLVKNVREGDMSLVLKAYENEIKHPLKNAIKGDLIQTLLIQVQKTKVDVDLAMTALDKLLKSNELNFAFLAVAPSMLFTWATINWINGIYQRRTGRQLGKTGLPIRQTMRRIERLFNTTRQKGAPNGGMNDILLLTHSDISNNSLQTQLDCESQGKLICEVHLLRSYARCLPTRNSVRDLFIEDLRDLENPRLSISQKLQTINRMSRSWSFLQPTA